MNTKNKLTLDLVIFTAFLAVANPHLTGNTIHEWLGVSMIAGILTHILFSWSWIVKVSKEFFKRLWHRSRLNFVVNAFFFIAMTGTLLSGILISKDVISTLGMQLNVSGGWKMLHTLMADAAVMILGVHVALHWKWIVNSIGRYIVSPVRGLFQRRTVRRPMVPQTVRIEKVH